MLDIHYLNSLDQVEFSVSTPGCIAWESIFPVAHMAEHLMGRCLLREPHIVNLTGAISAERIAIRFVAPRDRARSYSASEISRKLLDLECVSEETYSAESRTLSVEDGTLPRRLRSSACLPGSLTEFQRIWRALGPVGQLRRWPFLSGELADKLRNIPVFDECMAKRFDVSCPSHQTERAQAYASVCRRLGRPPELFLDGGALQSYYGPTSIFLAGLSAYRSPLFQRLRKDGAIYTFGFFDFPWRRCFFIAFVAKPAVGEQVFAVRMGHDIVSTISRLTDNELHLILLEGVLKKLSELDAILTSPRKFVYFRYLAELNGFNPDPYSAACALVGHRISHLKEFRERLLMRFDERLRYTTYSVEAEE